MHINQFLAQGGEHLEGGGGTVDELAVGPGGGEDAFEDQLMIRARFQAIFFKKAGRHAAVVVEVENGFDRATVAAGAQEGAIGPFAQEQVERADDDGFARAGFAGDDIVAGLQLQSQIGNQGQILNAQGGQHGGAAFIMDLGKIRRAPYEAIFDWPGRIFNSEFLPPF
jgi:hypothetical protein